METEAGSRLSIFYAEKIEMVNRHPTVRIFVDEGECRAVNSGRAAQAGGETLHKLSFAAAKVASQGDDIARFDIFCEAPAERFCLGGAI